MKANDFSFLPYRWREYLSGGYSSTPGLAAMYHGQTTSKGPSNSTQIYQQPPRLLIVHIALPSWADLCSNLCEALQNFFSLACSLMGPRRMSLFSLYIVQNQHECILPFVVSISTCSFYPESRYEVSGTEITVFILTVITVPIPHTQYPTGNRKSPMSSYTWGICTAEEETQNY